MIKLVDMLDTPILLITFNRPDHTQQVLNRILEVSPRHLYVFQDGPRENNSNDAARCGEVRQVISRTIEQNTSTVMLHTYYSDVNLGCGAGPMTAISWFFSNVEQGIVMEDDCLAHPDFFGYCEALLNRYRDNTDVMFINSTLYDSRWACKINESYGFSRYMVTGAWASWREVWQGFDLDLKNLNLFKFHQRVLTLTHNRAEADWWSFAARAIKNDHRKKSYWDYQMQVHLFLKNAITIHPSVNLVSNIGFDAEGTHTLTNDGRGDRPVYPILPLTHPQVISVDWRKDSRCWAKKVSRGWFKDILLEIYHLFKWRNKKFI